MVGSTHLCFDSVDSLPAAMEPWKRLTTQHDDELGYWFDELEKRAGRDLEAVGEVQDDTTGKLS